MLVMHALVYPVHSQWMTLVVTDASWQWGFHQQASDIQILIYVSIVRWFLLITAHDVIPPGVVNTQLTRLQRPIASIFLGDILCDILA